MINKATINKDDNVSNLISNLWCKWFLSGLEMLILFATLNTVTLIMSIPGINKSKIICST